ncbi:MAG: hypothetical protein OEY52_16775 [Gammaproteobacteria bacterium]|nr:hypothetical protein [Gammaproteobacteria bacterium]
MTKQKRKKWINLYHSEVPVVSRLLGSVLVARGFAAKYQKRKMKGFKGSVPLVRVEEHEAEQVKDLLSYYRLTSL